MAATYTAEQVAELVGVSSWAIYAGAREGTLPAGLEPIRIGRRLVWPRARVDAALGIEPQDIERSRGACFST